MGTQCVHTTISNNSPHQILHSIQRHHGVMTNSRKPCKLQAKDYDNSHKQASEEGTECSYNFGQYSNQMDNFEVFQSFEEDFIKNETDRKSKKRIHLMFPKGQQSQQNFDNVIFLSAEITSPHQKFISSALQDHCIFSQLADNQKGYLISKMRYCKSAEGSYIFQQGNQSQSFYILIEGQCRVQINGEIRKIIEKGNYFGDLGVIYCTARSASIFCQKQCLLAELSNKEFRKILEELNQMSEKENRQFLENADFYQQLNELQKNVLASSCLTQFYHSGQRVFNKGDIANSMYLVKQGELTIVEKNIDLKKGENFGMNAIMTSAQTLRTNSIVAKTDCKLLSLTREIIINSLGSDIGKIIRQNLTLKILRQSKIWKMFSPQQWNRALENMVTMSFNKNDLIFEKGTTIQPLKLTIILSTDAICNSEVCYKSNSIIEPGLVLKKKQITFDNDFYSKSEGYCITLDLTKEKMKNQIYMRSNSGNNIKRMSTDSDCIKEGKEIFMCLKDFIVLKKIKVWQLWKSLRLLQQKNG